MFLVHSYRNGCLLGGKNVSGVVLSQKIPPNIFWPLLQIFLWVQSPFEEQLAISMSKKGCHLIPDVLLGKLSAYVDK